MLEIKDIRIGEAAWRVLDRRLSEFAARQDAPALVYMSRFVEPDGTTVVGFRPGYVFGPWPMDHLDGGCGVVQFPGRRSLYLVPRTGWKTDIRYTVDLISERLGLFSIDPMG